MAFLSFMLLQLSYWYDPLPISKTNTPPKGTEKIAFVILGRGGQKGK